MGLRGALTIRIQFGDLSKPPKESVFHNENGEKHPAELPVKDADLVVSGTVKSYQPYLPAKKDNIYTEFIVRVEGVLKPCDSCPPVPENHEIAMTQSGGSVRRSDGGVERVEIRGYTDPLQIGMRYVVFLKYQKDGECYVFAKSWSLAGGRALPMAVSDWKLQKAHRSKYAGMSEADLFRAIGALAAASPSR